MNVNRGAGLCARHDDDELSFGGQRRPPHRLWDILILCASVVFFAAPLFAQTLETLDAKISAIDSRIASLNKEYQTVKKENEERLRKAADQELKAAYADAERLNRINSQLNALKAERAQLCEQWHTVYRKTIDDLLLAAEQVQDRKKKGEIGRKLQDDQARNARLCAQNFQALVSQEWRSLRIESYDGPQEINQKIQLLHDISREVMIGLTRLDAQYQDALRERKTRERAQEFIQEGTLFNETLAVRSPTASRSNGPSSPSVEIVDHPPGDTGNQNNPALVLGSNDWQTLETDRFEARYKKNRNDLLTQQEDLQKKIREFDQRAKAFLLP